MRLPVAMAMWLYGVVCGAACASHPSPGPQTTPSPTASAPVLGAGDVFEVRVFGEEELTGEYRVGSDGAIEFPLIGRVMVDNKTDSELAQVLTERLSKFVRSPHVSVFVKELNSKKVFVLGEVQQPGTFPYEEGMSIIQAVTMAGGFSRLADQDGTYVTRKSDGAEERIRVRVKSIGEGKETNFELKPGDIVYVPESIF